MFGASGKPTKAELKERRRGKKKKKSGASPAFVTDQCLTQTRPAAISHSPAHAHIMPAAWLKPLCALRICPLSSCVHRSVRAINTSPGNLTHPRAAPPLVPGVDINPDHFVPPRWEYSL